MELKERVKILENRIEVLENLVALQNDEEKETPKITSVSGRVISKEVT